tara:strand:- start:46624 stop:47937 length:1314 start_codon:yes stop_codon:yes gene_type:complete
MYENLTFISLIFGLILLSGFFSITESSIFSLQRYQIDLIKKKSKVGKLLESFIKTPSSIIATILLADEILNVTITSLISTKLDSTLKGSVSEELISVIAVLVTSIVILIFCEIIPKTIGVKFSRTLSVYVARPVEFLNRIMFPLTLFFDFISRKLVDLFKIKNDDGLLSSSRTNITSLIDIGEDEGSVKTSETQLIDNFLKLDKIPLSKILTPEPDLYMIEKDTPIAKVIEENMNYGFSRIPVYEGDSDNIIGIVHSKDLLNHTGENITQLLRDPFFVPVQKKALTLLREMQLMRLHIALVIDEYGRLKGIVTLDDILEEIFGEIEDEKEISEENISFQNNQIYLLGGTKIKEFNQTCLFAALRESGLESLSNNIIESQIPEDEGIETVGGYIFTRLGRLPKEGESIDCGKIELIVDKISNNRITKILLRRKGEYND